MAYGPYWGEYYNAGWRCIIPVPPESKFPPPEGYTGEYGADDIDPERFAEWQQTHYQHSIAIRLPAGVIAIDVDHYEKTKTLPNGSVAVVDKRGDDTLREHEALWGPLPVTWCSTARGTDEGPGLSRTLFYRVPVQRYRSCLGDPRTSAVEILQRHHRYAVVWPSLHTQVQALYRWYGPDGRPVDRIPRPDELTGLPEPWIQGLAEGASTPSAVAAAPDLGRCMLAAILAGDEQPCAEITNAHQLAVTDFEQAGTGSRHDTASRRVFQLIKLGAFGHPGAGGVLVELAGLWEELTAGEGRSGEWERMCVTAAQKAVTEVGASVPVTRDPCAMVTAWEPPTPVQVPSDDEAADTDVIEVPPAAPEMVWSRRDLIGTHAFDPIYGLDQTLAREVLTRSQPVLRYATDSNVWLLRGPHHWYLLGDMAEWAVAELADLMPHGSPDADKGTPERDRAERRKRFMSSGPAGAIASKMRAMVRAPGHPCTVELADLDSDPEILWAGGLPWDLRQSIDRPRLAAVDPATPHLHSAGVAPSGEGIDHPTPVWDIYTAAIWPDPAVREYALQILAISLTGYADAVLPILWGETGLGKTSVIVFIMSLLGTYAMAADTRILTSLDNTHASVIYALKGRRLAFIDEGPRDAKLAVSALKRLTGGGELTGNPMRGNPVEFAPTHTLILTCNPEETPSFGDPALRRRVRLLPCEGDPAAVAATRAALSHDIWLYEAPGVLAKLMHYAGLWLADRSVAAQDTAPPGIRYRAEEIAVEQDLTLAWVDAEMDYHADGTRSSELLALYAGWLRSWGARSGPPSPTMFGRKLTELGYPLIHRHDGKYRPLRPRKMGVPGPWVPPPSAPSMAPPSVPVIPPETVIRTSATAVQPVSAVADELTNQSPHLSTPSPERSPQMRDTNKPAYAEVRPPKESSCPEVLLHTDEDTDDTSTDSHDRGHEQPKQDHDEHQLSGMSDLLEQLNNRCRHSSTFNKTDNTHLDVQKTVTGLTGFFNPSPNPSPPLPQVDHNVDYVNDGLTGLRPLISQSEKNRKTLSGGKGGKTRQPVTDDLNHMCDLAEHRDGLPLPNPSQPVTQDHCENGLPLTEQQEAIEGTLTPLRARRTALNREIKKDAPGTRPELRSEVEALTTEIKSWERQRNMVKTALRRAAKVTDLGGELIALPALKTRGQPPRGVPVDEAAAWVRQTMAARGGRVTADIESSGYPLGHPDYFLRSVQLGDGTTAAMFDPADPAQYAASMLLLAEATEIEAYSAAVEISHLAYAGLIDYRSGWARAHDVVIKSQLNNPVDTLSSDAGLKPQAQLHLPNAVTPAAEAARARLFAAGDWLTEIKKKGAQGGGWQPVERSGWANVPNCRTWVDYGISDVLDTAELGRVLPMPAAEVYARERAVQAAVGAVSYVGIKLDLEHIEAKIAEHEPLYVASKEALRIHGIDNPNSDDQVAAVLINHGAQVGPHPGMLVPTAKTGKPSVAKDVLDKLPRTDTLGPLIDQLKLYRKHGKALNTYLYPYRMLCIHGDGRMRSTVYTLQADTGRMSCVNYNLQNVTRIGGMRESFVADSGDLFIDADLAGIEVAVLAALSQDPVLLDIVRSGQKLHKIIAKMVYGEKHTNEQYSYVKNGVFAKLYGAGLEKIAVTVGCSLEDAQRIVKALDELAPHARSWGYQLRDRVKAGMTQLALYSGRVLHLPAQFPHKIVNYYVQGTAREVLVDGILRWRASRWGDYGLLVPVHDEILASVPAAEAPQAVTTLLECMRTTLYDVEIGADQKWLIDGSERWLGNDSPLAKP